MRDDAIEVAEAWAQNRLREGDKRIMCGELEGAIEVAIELQKHGRKIG